MGGRSHRAFQLFVALVLGLMGASIAATIRFHQPLYSFAAAALGVGSALVTLATGRISQLERVATEREAFHATAIKEAIRANPTLASLDPNDYVVVDLNRLVPRNVPSLAFLMAAGVIATGTAIGLGIALGISFHEGPTVFGPLAGGLALTVSALPLLASAYADRQAVDRVVSEMIDRPLSSTGTPGPVVIDPQGVSRRSGGRS